MQRDTNINKFSQKRKFSAYADKYFQIYLLLFSIYPGIG